MNKYLVILVIALGAALIIVSQRSCTSKAITTEQQNIGTEQHQKDSLQEEIDSILSVKNDEKNIYIKTAIIWQYKYDSIISAEKSTRGLIHARDLDVQGLLHQLDSLQQNPVQSASDCAELQTQVQLLMSLGDKLEQEIDSANDAHDSIVDTKDSIIGNLQIQLTDVKKALQSLMVDYNQAISNEKKFIRKAKATDLLAKMSTIAAALLGIIAVIKK